METKQLLRQKLKSQREQISNGDLLSQQIAERSCAFMSQQTGVWASYKPINGEVDPAYIENQNNQITWAYPRVNEGQMEFRVPECGDSFSKGAFGVLEPEVSSSQLTSVGDLNGVLLPMLAVDKKGTRLGMGKGYYDKTLNHYNGIKVAVGYEFQVTNSVIPREAWDVPVDYIATEKEFFCVSGKELES